MTTPTHDQLAEALRPHLPDPSVDVSIERVPTGKFNDLFFVRADSQDWVVRVAPASDAVFLFYERNMMAQEPGLHRVLLDRTEIPVAPVVAYDTGHRVIQRDFLVLQRLPGTPLSETVGADFARVLHQTGVFLRQAHAITADTYGYIGEHRPMAPQSNWQDAFAIMWHKLIDDVVATGHYSADDESRTRRLLDDRLELFDRRVPASLLHMDVWAQNILVDGTGAVTGLLDWDRALWGDPEIEFAVLDYCGISEPPFWEGYGRARDTSPEARVRNIIYLLYEMQKYIVIRHGRSHDPAAARAYRQRVMHIIQSSGL